MRVGKSGILVFEYNGTARSGKGSIVRHLASTKSGAIAEETGEDYRAVTKALLSTGVIKPGMQPGTVVGALGELSEAEITAFAAEKANVLKRFGFESLHKSDVNELVPVVASVDNLRTAVKAGFKKRIENIRDSRKYKVLLVDGRNLAPIIQSIAGMRLILRIFVYCSPEEAALRECEREGVAMKSPEGQKILASIKARNQMDASRPTDAVRPDKDAIDYWKVKNAVRIAVQEGRQIYFDTTTFRRHGDPKQTMLDEVGQIYDQALQISLIDHNH